jgi:hypothetical protein
MSNKYQQSFSDYAAGIAIVVVSAIGLLNAKMQGYFLSPEFLVVILPYLFALLLGALFLFGFKWTRFPIVIISAAGALLNVKETCQDPNQKDIAEVAIFVLIIVLALIGYRRKN